MTAPLPVGAALLARLDEIATFRAVARPVVGIAGESGSGKTTAAEQLAAAAQAAGRAAVVLHQDDYFLRPPHTNHAHRCGDLSAVGPHEVDLARLARHVAEFRSGARAVSVPAVDYPGDRFVARTVDFSAAALLVVEGTYVLTLEALDARVFCAATHEQTRDRRRARNRDVDAPIVDEILAIEQALILPQRARADLVVAADFTIGGLR